MQNLTYLLLLVILPLEMISGRSPNLLQNKAQERPLGVTFQRLRVSTNEDRFQPGRAAIIQILANRRRQLTADDRVCTL
jgi:hypothetical protein